MKAFNTRVFGLMGGKEKKEKKKIGAAVGCGRVGPTETSPTNSNPSFSFSYICFVSFCRLPFDHGKLLCTPGIP